MNVTAASGCKLYACLQNRVRIQRVRIWKITHLWSFSSSLQTLIVSEKNYLSEELPIWFFFLLNKLSWFVPNRKLFWIFLLSRLANRLAVFLVFSQINVLFSPGLIGVCSCLAVKSIKKQHLVEVRSMANPPAAVKLALESICLLLGESTTDWKQIRSIIMRENFIPTIVNFSAEEIRWITASTQRLLLGTERNCSWGPLQKSKGDTAVH